MALAANAIFYRVTEQKTPSGKTVGWNILGGFDPKLKFATAAYKESATTYATTDEIKTVVDKMVKHANAECATDLTVGGMLKKIAANDESGGGRFRPSLWA